MHHFFVEQEILKQTPVLITGGDYNHIKHVLRLKRGERVILSGEDDREYECEIIGYNEEEKQVLLEIVDVFGSNRELPAEITLFQGYPKGDKLETVVQKAVELGAARIVPVSMKRSVVKLDEKKAEKKVERLNAIALSAAKQSGRGIVPEVTKVMTMAEACEYAKDMDYLLLPYENAEGMEHARKVMQNAKGKKRIGVFIGPEGGFESTEIESIKEIGGEILTLGHRILRTETAGLTTLSLLMFLLDEE